MVKSRQGSDFRGLGTLAGTNSVQPHYKSPSEPVPGNACWGHLDVDTRWRPALCDVDT